MIRRLACPTQTCAYALHHRSSQKRRHIPKVHVDDASSEPKPTAQEADLAATQTEFMQPLAQASLASNSQWTSGSGVDSVNDGSLHPLFASRLFSDAGVEEYNEDIMYMPCADTLSPRINMEFDSPTAEAGAENTGLAGMLHQAVSTFEQQPEPGGLVNRDTSQGQKNGVDDDVLLREILSVFLERLHPSMPFFKRPYILDNVAMGRHHSDRSFAALLNAICALTLLQPIQEEDQWRFPNRLQQADMFLKLATKLHSDDPDFGEKPSLETIMTSVFLFGCQFCKGNHNSAQVRLREAVALAEILCLYEPVDEYHVIDEERDRKSRTVVCLVIISRLGFIGRQLPMLAC